MTSPSPFATSRSAPTRRGVLGSAAVVAAAAATGLSPADAAAPPAAVQAPGFYRYTLGSVQVTVLNDGVSRMPIGDGFVLNASKADVQAALAAAFMNPDVYAGPYNPILINTGAKLVLVDTGTGEAAFKASNGLNGRLMQTLAAAGIAPEQIDAVVLTHYHGDHINGLVRADGTVAFPNAEVLAPAREHAFWTDEGEIGRARNPRVPDGARNVRRVLAGGIAERLRTYEWDKEVLPGLVAVGTPGHTPGHTSLVLASGGKQVYIQGDVTHAPFLFARNPGWHFMLDVDPVAAEATRRKVYEMLVAERMPVQGFHYPFPALAHVERSGTGYREVLLPWSAAL